MITDEIEAIIFKHLAGRHNQKRHGWRFGSIDAARRSMRNNPDKAERDEYRKRAGMPEPKKIERPVVPQKKKRADIVRERIEKIDDSKLVEIDKQIEDGTKEVAQLLEKIKSAKEGDEYASAIDAYESKRLEVNKLIIKQQKMLEEVNQQYVDALAVDDPIEIKVGSWYGKIDNKKYSFDERLAIATGKRDGQGKDAVIGDISEEKKQKITNGIDAVQKIVSKSVVGNQDRALEINTGKGSLRASYGLNRINIRSGGSATMAHELGHFMEDNYHGLNRKTYLFLSKRTAGEKAVPYGRSRTEAVKKDKFIDQYMGKLYPNGTTEILSMGLQMLLTNPKKLLRQDPEYFYFMIGLIQGE